MKECEIFQQNITKLITKWGPQPTPSGSSVTRTLESNLVKMILRVIRDTE